MAVTPVRTFRFTITTRATGPISRARAIAIILFITAGCISAMLGIMDRSTIATSVAAANIGMADAGAAARCTQAQDYAEISHPVLAGIAAITVTTLQDVGLDGARGAAAINA